MSIHVKDDGGPNPPAVEREEPTRGGAMNDLSLGELLARAQEHGSGEAVFTLTDGSQVLLTLWGSGAMHVATRSTPVESWGPPAEAKKGWH